MYSKLCRLRKLQVCTCLSRNPDEHIFQNGDGKDPTLAHADVASSNPNSTPTPNYGTPHLRKERYTSSFQNFETECQTAAIIIHALPEVDWYEHIQNYAMCSNGVRLRKLQISTCLSCDFDEHIFQNGDGKDPTLAHADVASSNPNPTPTPTPNEHSYMALLICARKGTQAAFRISELNAKLLP